MLARGEPTFLAIADVTGYTSYLAGVELDHATDILADLIGTVVDTMAPFRLSKLEGDAVLASLDGPTIDPSTLQDVIEGTYLAFRRRLRDIGQATSCECDACVLIPRLDLKLVVHHGLVARQRMLGLEELVGPDVILVHRLLKNSVTNATGVVAYALYTAAAVAAAGMNPVRQRLREHREITDVAGEVTTWVRDLAAVWEAEVEGPLERIPAAAVGRTWHRELPVPVPVAWEYLTSPARRPAWTMGVSEIIEMAPDDRRGVGTTNHCMHGKDVVIERILAWRPPHYWLTRSSLPEAIGGVEVLVSDELIETPDGRTHVTLTYGFADVDPAHAAALVGPMEAILERLLASLTDSLTAVAAERAAAAELQPTVPASRARHRSSPVRRDPTDPAGARR